MKARDFSAFLLVFVTALTGCDSSLDDDTAEVRVANLSPDSEGVNVSFDDTRVVTGLDFPFETSYISINSGTWDVVVEDSESLGLIFDGELDFNDGTATTLYMTGFVAEMNPVVLEDSDEGIEEDEMLLRFLHASPTAGGVDIVVASSGTDIEAESTLVNSLPFREASSYVAMEAGEYHIQVRDSATGEVLLDRERISLDEEEGHTVAIMDNSGDTDAQMVVSVFDDEAG